MSALFAAVAAAVCAYLVVGTLLGTLPGPVPRRRRRRRRRPRGGRGVIAGSSALFVVALAAGSALTGTVRVAAVPSLLAAGLPFVHRGRAQRRKMGEIQASWPDGLRHLAASVRSGSTLVSAVNDLAVSGPEPLRGVLAPFPRLMRLLGFEAALESIRGRVADPTTDRVVEVLLVAHDAGGSLIAEILEDLAVATSADLRAAEEMHTAALEQHLNARIVFVLPWLVLVLLTAAEGAYREFYRSRSAGLVVIGLGAALTTSGALLLRKLGAVEIEERVFPGGT